jgi:alpha-1,6-mannosyltransferase
LAIKTLHITNAWHPTSGGVSTFYRALGREANRRGHELRLIVPGAQDGLEPVDRHVLIYHVAAPPAFFNPAYRTIYPNQYLLHGSKLQKILARERPDLIEISDKYTLAYLGGLLRHRLLPALDFRPLLVGLSNERMDDNFRSYLGWIPFGKQFCSWYMRRVYFPLFDHHIANSVYTAEELRAASLGHLVRRGIWVRPMGADLSEYSPAHRTSEGRRRLVALCRADADSVILLYAGRLVPEKNLSLLFEMMECLNRNSPNRRFHLIVAGDGIERRRWEQYSTERLPGKVVFLGHIREMDMLTTLLANADIFVHPNPREPFGIAPLEAMASGTPLLAPNTGGVTAYANMENAWTVPATVADFSAAILELLANPQLTRQKTRKAMETAQSYRWEKVSAGFLDLYQELYAVFHGETATLPADTYSTTAKPGTARLLHWASQAAQKAFTIVVRPRASMEIPETGKSQQDAAGTLKQKYHRA